MFCYRCLNRPLLKIILPLNGVLLQAAKEHTDKARIRHLWGSHTQLPLLRAPAVDCGKDTSSVGRTAQVGTASGSPVDSFSRDFVFWIAFAAVFLIPLLFIKKCIQDGAGAEKMYSVAIVYIYGVLDVCQLPLSKCSNIEFSQQCCDGNAVIIPISQIREFRHRVKWLPWVI